MKITLLFSLLLCSTPAFAQTTYADGSAGPGGFTPELSCPSAWLGRPSFGFQVDRGLGGAPVHLGISYATGSSVMYGAPVSIDVSQLQSSYVQTLSGAAGTPGVGSTNFALNLPPANPAYYGITVYAQAGVLDTSTGVMAASNAIRVTLSREPELFAASNYIGNYTWSLIDGQSYTITDSGTFAATTYGAVYANGGQDLYVGGYAGGIQHADLRGSTPAWSTLWSTGSDSIDLHLDAGRKRLWTLENPSSGVRELACIDVDSNSPTYGQRIATTSGVSASGLVEIWTMSDDGNLAAVFSVFTGRLFIWDLDPTSPTYLTQLHSLPVPGISIWPSASSAAFTTDNSELIVTILGIGTENAEIARLDISTAQWIDHNATLAGQQHIGDLSDPPIYFGAGPTSIDIAPSGNWLVASGFSLNSSGSNGWMGRLDFTPNSSSGYSWTPVAASTADAWECVLDSGGEVIAVSTSGDANGDIQFFDATTLLRLGGTYLVNNLNIHVLSLR